MARASLPVRRLALTGLMVLLFISAFLPARFSGYADRLSRFADTVLILAHPIRFVSARARHAITGRTLRLPEDYQAVIDRLPPENSDAAAAIAGLLAQLERENQINYALALEAAKLQEENAALRNLRALMDPRAAERLRLPQASVMARSSDPAAGTFVINRGGKDGLAVGQPVVSGADLVGRIVAVGPLTATYETVLRPELRIEGVIEPQRTGASALTSQRRQRCQFAAAAAGRLVADDVPTDTPADVGDLFRLVDPDWPDTVQGMIVGRVVRVEPQRDQPLLQRVVVEPRISLAALSRVTVIVRQQTPSE